MRRWYLLALCLTVAVTPVSVADESDPVSRAIQSAIETNRAARRSQQKIDRVDDETQRMLDAYREATWKSRQLQLYNQQLETLIESQTKRIETIKRQIDEIEVTRREIMPLMSRMIDTLEQFVALDLPFLLDERNARIRRLRNNLGDAEIALGEKYRQIIEAYEIETEYGRTLESWRGQLGDGDDARTVDFLRVGRLAMYYQGLDREDAGYWDADREQWLELDERSQHGVRQGIRMAREHLAPDLLELPVPVPRSAP